MADVVKGHGRLPEARAAVLLGQVLSALHYLHSRCIIHRDLKLGNLFLDEAGAVKVRGSGTPTTFYMLPVTG